MRNKECCSNEGHRTGTNAKGGPGEADRSSRREAGKAHGAEAPPLFTIEAGESFI